MSFDCSNRIDGFGFTPEQIADCAARRGLLSMELEVSRACNFRCPYCYVSPEAAKSDLTFEEMTAVLAQARELGARRIILLGGEPMIYPRILELIDHIRGAGMEVEIFTNGSKVTPDTARFLYERDVTVVLKLNTLDRDLQNRLTGCARGYETIHGALANLKAAGYPTATKRLALSTVICNDNFEEIPGLWRWVRAQGMLPYFEMITPQGSARDNPDMLVSGQRVRALFEQLAEIDREEFQRFWEPQPPLVGNACKRHQFSCVVTADGTVFSCVGVTIPLGNIRQTPLKEILHTSEVLEDLRDYRNKIKQPCRDCAKAADCYGCRGAAYQLTGDYLAGDPLCWHAASIKPETLPISAVGLVPHGPLMRLVDELVRVGDRHAEAAFTVTADCLFVDESGHLDETAYVEMIAQSAAAWHRFHLLVEQRGRHGGYLLQIKDLKIAGRARVGDRLRIDVRKVARYEPFGIFEGEIRLSNGHLVAQSELKVIERLEPAATKA